MGLAQPAPTPPPPASKGVRVPTARERLLTAMVGGVLGGILGLPLGVGSIFTGLGCAVAGAIAGNRRTVIVTALVGVVVGWTAVSAVWTKGGLSFVAGGFFGVPWGAILGAIAGVIYLRKHGPRETSATKPPAQ
jgi:uncharacterized membrane protein YfcA